MYKKQLSIDYNTFMYLVTACALQQELEFLIEMRASVPLTYLTEV